MIRYAFEKKHNVTGVTVAADLSSEPVSFINRKALEEMSMQPILTNCVKADLSGTSVVDVMLNHNEDLDNWQVTLLFHNPGDRIGNHPDVKEEVDFEGFDIYADEKDPLKLFLAGPNLEYLLDYEKEIFHLAVVNDEWMDLSAHRMIKHGTEIEVGKVKAMARFLKKKSTDTCIFAEFGFVLGSGKDLKDWKHRLADIVKKITGESAAKEILN